MRGRLAPVCRWSGGLLLPLLRGAMLDTRRGARSAAGTASGAHPSLQATLRSLYKLVHPDLFQQHPDAQAENERSFKLLQEYLSAARGAGGEAGPLLPYNFVFYLHAAAAGEREAAEEGDGDRDEDRDGPQLQRVALTLPPPARRVPGQPELPRATLTALRKLLVALGLEQAAQGALAAGAVERAPLREYIPQAVELMHQRAATSDGGFRAAMSTARLALQYGRQVSVGFEGAPASAGPAAQLTMLQVLVEALDRCPDDVRSARIVICDRYGVDAAGRVMLNSADGRGEWARYLSLELDPARLAQHAAAARALAQLEAYAAAALGVGMLFSSGRMQGDAGRYRQALEAAAEAAARHGRIGDAADISRVPVCVAEPGEMPVCGEDRAVHRSNNTGTSAGAVDEQRGVVYIWPHATADQWHAALKALTPHAAAVRAGNEAAAALSASLQRQVERKLRLRRLTRAEALRHDQYRSACMRLLTNAGPLVHLLEGLSLRVTTDVGVAHDGTYIDIPWDFEI